MLSVVCYATIFWVCKLIAEFLSNSIVLFPWLLIVRSSSCFFLPLFFFFPFIINLLSLYLLHLIIFPCYFVFLTLNATIQHLDFFFFNVFSIRIHQCLLVLIFFMLYLNHVGLFCFCKNIVNILVFLVSVKTQFGQHSRSICSVQVSCSQVPHSKHTSKTLYIKAKSKFGFSKFISTFFLLILPV